MADGCFPGYSEAPGGVGPTDPPGLDEINVKHRTRLLCAIFTNRHNPDSVPEWLSSAVGEMRQRYARIRTNNLFDKVLDKLNKSSNQPFEIFVVGEGNYGKSTLLNVLLGEARSSVSIKAETRSFLRFIPSRNPSGTATLYTRCNNLNQEWVLERLGPGVESSEFANCRIHKVPVALASEVFEEDLKRCRHDQGYEPSVIELETEIAITDRSSLPPHVRLVDTQGLNQLFNVEVAGALKEDSSRGKSTTLQDFERWMRENPRGKHLDWEFSRTDAVIWLACAVDPGSMVTTAAMRHFRRYGKHTILAVTKIDGVPGGPSKRAEVLKSIDAALGSYVDETYPIDARLALKGVLDRREDLVEESGLPALRKALLNLVVRDRALVRGRSAYESTREVEGTVRSALRSYRTVLLSVIGRLENERQQLEDHKKRVTKVARKALSESAGARRNTLEVRTRTIGLADGGSAAGNKLRIDELIAGVNTDLQGISSAAIEEIRSLCLGFAASPYSLPEFDAEGKRTADVLHMRFTFTPKYPVIHAPSISVNIDASPFADTILGIRTWIGEKFEKTFGLGGGIRDRALRKRAELDAERQASVGNQIFPVLDKHVAEMFSELDKVIDTVCNQAGEELARVETELCKYECRPLQKTVDVVDDALSTPPMPPAVMTNILRAVRARRLSVDDEFTAGDFSGSTFDDEQADMELLCRRLLDLAWPGRDENNSSCSPVAEGGTVWRVMRPFLP